MSGWVHEQTVTQHAGTRVCGPCYLWNDICTTPTPDPSSPCGYRFDFWTMTDVCEMPGDHPMHLYSNARMYHDFVPTRCTCGHPIEERA